MMIHAKRMCLAVLFATIVAHGTGAQEMDRMRQYLVTIENLSSGQPLTPPLIATHTEKVQLYQVGDAAGPGVQAIAENGDLIPLLEWLEGSMEVADVVVSDAGPLVPAGNPGGTDFASSVTLTVSAGPRAHHLSFISMLICTNDGFTALNSVTLPRQGSRVLFVSGYDAGTETNTEDFADMVPPCQGLSGVSSTDAGTGVTNPSLAEGGVIHYHEGIVGGDDLLADLHGWQNPVAKVTITCLDEAADRFVAPLGGGGSVPSVNTYATGHIELNIDWEHQTVHAALFTKGLSGITQAHIHVGLPSESGPPVAFLYGMTPATDLVEGLLSRAVIGTDDLLNNYAGDFRAFVDALRSGQLYANVHTADNAAGAIRGQIGVVARGHRPYRR